MGLVAFFAILFLFAAQGNCGDVPERACASLFSAVNYGGEYLTLGDFEQAVNLKREYRHSLQGWKDTGSLRVSDGCRLTACSDVYFLGNCRSFTSDEAKLTKSMPVMKSASCTCERKCSCDDVIITHDQRKFGEIGRAYLKGGCDSCNSEYVQLYQVEDSFQEADRESVEAMVLHTGCSVTISTEPDHKGDKLDAIEGPVHRGSVGKIGSFTAQCNPHTIRQAPAEFEHFLKLGDLPAPLSELNSLLLSNESLAGHPGIRAMRHSLLNKRSSRYVYVVILGEDRPSNLGFPHCSLGDRQKIGEYRIPVGDNDLRLNTELRLVYIPTFNHRKSAEGLVQEIEDYWSKHEELNRIIPNAVIIHHPLSDPKIGESGSELLPKLTALKQLRNRLVDGNFKNVVFQLSDLHDMSPEEQRNPANQLTEFEEVIKEWLPSINPVHFSISSAAGKAGLHYVNGYVKLQNEEYWPLNLEEALENICDKAGDELGESVLNEYFEDNWTPHSSIKQQFPN